MGRWLGALALLIACTRAAAAEDARPTLPATLDDVYGKRVDVAELAAKHRLVVALSVTTTRRCFVESSATSTRLP